ncbi:MAG TPA: hypothetical protein VM580_00410, partial [Labilithrix sp.]|nr:hypothetical protein [Labilithrix sp.]
MARLSPVSPATLIVVFGPLVVPSGCGTVDEPVKASIVAKLTTPRGVLAKANELELRVLEGGVTCDAATGTVLPLEGGPTTREVAKSSLRSDNCANDVQFCGSVNVAQSSTPRIFEAKATDGTNILAVGCTTATIAQDSVAIDIEMFRFLEPSVCGDGKIQPTEQCEPGGSGSCDEACHSPEVLLSVGVSSNKTATGEAGEKTDPFFLWPAESGNKGRFLAFYTDRAVSVGS